jgi:hypothetical protein
MSVTLDLCLESEVAGLSFPVAQEYYDLALGNTLKRLNAIAALQGVVPLMDFTADANSSTDSDAFLSRLLGWEEEDEERTCWYQAGAVLPTVQALRAHLAANPRALRGALGPRQELEQMQQVLEAVQRANVHVNFRIGL